jgi:CHASE2 domain-containing sensor protein
MSPASGATRLRKLNPASLLRTETRRAMLLAGCVALIFAALGTVRAFAPVSFLAESPFNLDLALRTLSLGWFEPRHTVPVTIVDVDEHTHRAWGSPAVTPRAELERLLQTISRADPLVVVMDIDLSWGGAAFDTDPGHQQLAEFLKRYSGPAPIVLPKRVEPGPRGLPAPAVSPFDTIVDLNPNLAWAHASFQTDAGGAVREWAPWLAVCVDGSPAWLPAIATRVAADLPVSLHVTGRPVPPLPADCSTSEHSSRQRLLIGPRITGNAGAMFGRDARAISAALLLDPEVARDDSRLFGGRVVLVGATHASAGDFWLTPAGALPGVELLANSVRYAPQQAGTGPGAELAYRSKALVLFGLFAAAGWWLRGLVAVIAAMLVALLAVSVAVGGFDDLGIFDALEAAILLTVAYLALRALADFVVDWRTERASHPAGIHGTLGTLRAVCMRQD